LFFAIGHAFTDGPDNIPCFADSHSHLAVFITDHDDGPEAEFFTTLNHFTNPADLDDPLLPSGLFLFFAVAFATFCHSFISVERIF
jgi:hypothetical protein